MKRLLLPGALVLLAACTPQEPAANREAPAAASASAPIAPKPVDVPAGDYTLDKSHASLIFRVDHLGFSNYTARFRRFDARLQFDPSNPAAASLNATVDARSLETDYPDPATLDFNALLQGEQWLNTGAFPEITYRSTGIALTSPDTMHVDGELTLRGITKPVPLDVTFNGGYAGHPMDPHARIGFSARGSLRRSDFGVSYGIPEPGSKMGVSDAVEIIIEAEFSGPPLAEAARAPGEEQAAAEH